MKTPPTIEFRKFEHSARASQETNQFTADLYINGKKVGFVEDEGHGGAAWCRWDPDTKAEQELFKEYLAALEPWKFPESWGGDREPNKWEEEYFFSSLAQVYITHNDLKRRCSTHFCFKLKEQKEGVFFTQKFRTKKTDPKRAIEQAQLKASAVKEYGDKIEEIYNDRDFSKAPVLAEAKLREPATA